MIKFKQGEKYAIEISEGNIRELVFNEKIKHNGKWCNHFVEIYHGKVRTWCLGDEIEMGGTVKNSEIQPGEPGMTPEELKAEWERRKTGLSEF